MLAYTLKRLGLAALVAIAVSAASFLLLRLSGDVELAIAGEGARQQDIEMVRYGARWAVIWVSRSTSRPALPG
jgi:glutathione transport system permease protein